MTHHLPKADRLSLNLLLTNLSDYMKNTIFLLSGSTDYEDQEKCHADNDKKTEKEFIESFIEHPRILSWTPEKPDTQKAPLRGLFVVADFRQAILSISKLTRLVVDEYVTRTVIANWSSGL